MPADKDERVKKTRQQQETLEGDGYAHHSADFMVHTPHTIKLQFKYVQCTACHCTSMKLILKRPSIIEVFFCLTLKKI